MMPTVPALSIANGEAVGLKEVPLLRTDELRAEVLARSRDGASIAALFGYEGRHGKLCLLAVLADGSSGNLDLLSAEVGESYPSLALECPQAHCFERELHEQWRVQPEGHPWLKPLRFQAPYRLAPPRAGTREGKCSEALVPPAAGVADFFQFDGREVHEVAVGPVHAGVIEPGHFRFQCHGENVLHLEISLGYQHRGVERALVGGPNKRTIHYMETLAGDTTVGHATAYAEVLEALSHSRVPARAQVWRGIALELERLANHTGDLGALAGDVGFLPTASYCGRLRGEFLNLTALLCGSRLGRGLVRPGGVGFDAGAPRIEEMSERLERALKDVRVAADLLWSTSSVRARFEETGVVSREAALDLGLVGPAARASGVPRDVRNEFPTGIFRLCQIPVSLVETGDVYARAYLRWLEIQRSGAFIRENLKSLPGGPVRGEVGGLAPGRIAVSLVEGWRGQICHVALTDDEGCFLAYKVVDPSFHNWMGLAIALRGQQISDFPLCNKSFNLSYCGHDL